jgi:AraC-like DNA-binding protein
MNGYLEMAPPAHLAPIVECFWALAPLPVEPSASSDRIFPDGAADIVLSDDGLVVHGPHASFRLIARRPVAGVRLRRGAAVPALGISPLELAGRSVLAETLWSKGASTLRECTADATTPEARLTLLETLLTERLAGSAQADGAVLAAVRLIDEASSATDIRTLMEHTGCSERHLRRRFRHHVGLGIKQYARIIRFQRVLDSLRRHARASHAASPNWAAMALDYGFADQAHLIRETVALSGLTPVRLLGAV